MALTGLGGNWWSGNRQLIPVPVVEVSSSGFFADVDDVDGRATFSLQQLALVTIDSLGFDRPPVAPLLEMERNFASLALVAKHS